MQARDSLNTVGGNKYNTFGGTRRFEAGPAQDTFWAGFFVVHATAVLAFLSYRMNMITLKADEGAKLKLELVTGYFPVLFAALGYALVVGLAWTFLLRAFPKPITYMAVLLPFVFGVGALIVLASVGNGLGVASCALGLLCHAVYLYFMWRKIAFTAVLIQCTAGIMHAYPGMLAVTVAGLVSNMVWMFVCLLLSAIVKHDVKAQAKQGGDAAIVMATLFSIYWTTITISNTVHTTICGVVGRWYFGQQLGSPSTSALKRSLTTHFGSICFGSFIVAVVKLLKALVRRDRDEEENIVVAIIRCLVMCILSCIEDILEFINCYAFVHCALYGQSFLQSARSTMELFSRSGMAMIGANDFSSAVTFLGGLFGGLLTGLLTWATIRVHGPWLLQGVAANPSDLTAGYVTFAFLAGFGCVFVASSPIESGAAALVVCIAEEPAAIKEKHPELDRKLGELREEARDT